MKFNRIVLHTVCLVAFSCSVFAAGHPSHKTKSNLVNINEAKAADLVKVEGMSASKAHAILAYRNKHGKFKSLEELSNVKGFKHIKPEKLSALTQQMQV